MMMRLPFRQQLDSGELGGGNRGTYVEDAFAFEPGGGKMSLAELERRQAERERVWFERGERLRNFLQNTWANTESWVSPVLTGLERSGAAVAAPFVAIREMQRAPRNAAGGIEDWSEVRKVFTDVMEDPGNVNLGRVFPGALGLAADVLAPGPDLGHAARVVGPVLDGLSALLSRWEGVAPGVSAFLLPLRESVAKGSSSERIVELVDEAADTYLDPADADKFRREFRDMVFEYLETHARGLYPIPNYSGDDTGWIARMDILNNDFYRVFDQGTPGMTTMIDALENNDPNLGLWRSDPDLTYDMLRDPNDYHNTATRDVGRVSLDDVLEGVLDYKLPPIYELGSMRDRKVFGTDAGRDFEVRSQMGPNAADALSRYTTEDEADFLPFASDTKKNIASRFGNNIYNVINSYLRSLDSVRVGTNNANVPYDTFRQLNVSDPGFLMSILNAGMGPKHPLSWMTDPQDINVIEEEIALLDRAFRRVALPSDAMVYRGAFMSPDNPFNLDIQDLMAQARQDPNFSWDDAAKALIGTETIDRGFLSFTERPQHAYSFIRPKSYAARTDTGQDRVGILYQMRLPQGSPAIPLYGFRANDDIKVGKFPEEQEILLPRNLPMRVVDAQFRFPRDTGQTAAAQDPNSINIYSVDQAGELKPYLVVLVEPDFSGVR